MVSQLEKNATNATPKVHRQQTWRQSVIVITKSKLIKMTHEVVLEIRLEHLQIILLSKMNISLYL
jgi:hypothetical protein